MTEISPGNGIRNEQALLIMEATSVASERHPDRNEDAYFTLPQGIIGVFDGVGGEPGSEAASAFVATYCRDQLHNATLAGKPEEVNDQLAQVLRDADRALTREYAHSFVTRGIATTAILAAITTRPELYVHIAHAGDSRAYIYRDTQLTMATLDHSVASDQLDTEERWRIQHELADALYRHEVDPYYWPHLFARNQLRSYLTADYSHKRLTIDTTAIPLQPHDTILLTSDGIHDNLRNSEIATVLGSSKHPSSALVAAAQSRSRENHEEIIVIDNEEHVVNNFRPKPDDMTAVVLYS